MHWIVGTRRIIVVGDNFIRHLQKTMVIPRTTTSVVKNGIHGVDVETKPTNFEFIPILVFCSSNEELIDLCDFSDEDGIEILYSKFANMYVPFPCVGSTL